MLFLIYEKFKEICLCKKGKCPKGSSVKCEQFTTISKVEDIAQFSDIENLTVHTLVPYINFSFAKLNPKFVDFQFDESIRKAKIEIDPSYTIFERANSSLRAKFFNGSQNSEIDIHNGREKKDDQFHIRIKDQCFIKWMVNVDGSRVKVGGNYLLEFINKPRLKACISRKQSSWNFVCDEGLGNALKSKPRVNFIGDPGNYSDLKLFISSPSNEMAGLYTFIGMFSFLVIISIINYIYSKRFTRSD